MLLGLTVLTGNRGDFETSRRDAEEAIALHRELGDEWGAAYSTHMLANAIFDAGDLHTPEPLYQEAEQALRQLATG